MTYFWSMNQRCLSINTKLKLNAADVLSSAIVQVLDKIKTAYFYEKKTFIGKAGSCRGFPLKYIPNLFVKLEKVYVASMTEHIICKDSFHL